MQPRNPVDIGSECAEAGLVGLYPIGCLNFAMQYIALSSRPLVSGVRSPKRTLVLSKAATPANSDKDEQALFERMQAAVPDDFRLENRYDHMRENVVYSWVGASGMLALRFLIRSAVRLCPQL